MTRARDNADIHDGSTGITTLGTVATGTWQGTTVAVNQGGTGAATHTANNVMIGAGTSALTSIAPGADGQVLTSTGSVWNSEAAAGGGIITKISTSVSTTALSAVGDATTVEGDANDLNVTCTIGNKLHIWIIGGGAWATGSGNYFWLGMRIKESGESDVNVKVGTTYQRTTDYLSDTVPAVMYTHTAITTAVTVKRLIQSNSPVTAIWEILEGSVRYLVMEEEV